MACDEELVQRIRVALGDAADLSERRMFGGVCFMLEGHMVCGVVKDEMMVRVGPENYAKALEAPHAPQHRRRAHRLPRVIDLSAPLIRPRGRRFANPSEAMRRSPPRSQPTGRAQT